MFSNFAWSEILVIAVVAIIVVGPKDLPGMLRQIGKALGSVRRMGNEFQRQFNDAIKEAELDDLKDMTSAKGFGPLEDAKKSMENFTKTMEDSVSGVDIASEQASKPAAKTSPAKKATTAKTKSSTSKPSAKRAASKTASKPQATSAAKTKAASAPKSRARRAPAKAVKSAKSET